MKDLKQSSGVLRKFISLLLTVVMCFSFGVNVVFATTTIHGNWTIDNDSEMKTAKIKDMDFTYYTPVKFDTLSVGSGSSAKYGVQPPSISGESRGNGGASNGIVTTAGKSYAAYNASKEGTLTAYIGYGSSNSKILTISKRNNATNKDSAVGKCIALATETDGNDNKNELKITREKNWITADVEVESGYTYYFCVTGSRMACYDAKFVPYTELTGNITDKFNISDFGIKFVNSQTGQIKNAEVDLTNKTYSIRLKAGTYSASITGSNAAKYSFTQDTRTVKPTGETMTADFEIEECLSYQVKGSLSGFSDGYNLDDFELKFMPENSNDFQPAVAEINKENLTYSALLISGEKYTLQKNGANDYDFTETVTIKNTVQKKPDTEDGTKYILGDADGNKVIDINDAAVLLTKILNKNYKLPIEDEESDKYVLNYTKVVDVDHNNVLTSVDVSMILKKALDSSFSFPVNGSGSSSNNGLITEGEQVTENVSFKLVDTYQLNGKFIGLTQTKGEYETLNITPTSITFENLDDKYTYTGIIYDNGYSVNLRKGNYIASIIDDKYSTTTHIVIDNKGVSKDILLKEKQAAEVPFSDTIYVGSDKDYKTVQSAVDAVSSMKRTDSQRVTIKIDPGTYRERVFVTSPNITLESNGGDKTNTKITWYYGIGYKYYSAINDGEYSPYAEYDKHEKGNIVNYWGATVVTKASATGFRAKGICFENSFNKYMTEEEISDGVEPNGLVSIRVDRKKNTEVDTKNATERAAALVNYADKTEFLGCGFIGSQDTLYTCNVNYNAYYKNCYIEGQTDYIYGNGDVIFDGCELNWCGYNGTEASGYITAHSGSAQYLSNYGYVFRNCIVTGNKDKNRKVTSGYLGRIWGANATVNFINTQVESESLLIGAGWVEMNGNKPTDATVKLKEYNTNYNGTKVETSARVAGVVSDASAVADYTVEKMFIENGWTPVYYTAEGNSVPEITQPSFSANSDLNIPNPGMTVTVNYEINAECAANEASRISWYALNTDYNKSGDLTEILESTTLLYTTTSYKTKKFQIPMECAGKYIMAVVTPMTIEGKTGTPKYIIEDQMPVSNVWSNPDNPTEIAPGSGINIYLAGDSTVMDYSSKGMYNGGSARNEGSWGEFLQYFFDENYVTVNDYAQGGRAVRSFMNEGKLDNILKNIKEGDYLFIQFGHNDCANQAKYYEDRFVPLYAQAEGKDVVNGIYPTILPTEAMKQNGKYTWNCGATYKGFIQAYINAALDKKAIPVIVSPVARMYYNSDGTIKTHHDATGTDYEPTSKFKTSGNAYVTACKQLYDENIKAGNKIYYLDGYKLTETMFKDAWKISNNKTNGEAMMGKGDSTHCNKTGGVIEAGLFAKWIQDADLSISKYVIKPTEVYGENPDGKYIFTIENGVFTAKDNDYKENSYVTGYGQNLFDSIGGSSAAVTYTISGKTNLTSGKINLLDANGRSIASAQIENDGRYTFTVSSMADISKNSYSAKVDGYGKKEIKMTASSSEQTAYTAEDITFEEEIVVNEVNLDFTAALDLYETNADSTFTNGVYSGVYTNDDGQKFNASVYKSGIKYFNSQAHYGTAISSKNTPLFSFDADGEGMYTLTVTAATTGDGTIDLFKTLNGSSCSDSVANTAIPSGATVNLIYKKASSEKETLYFGASAVSNLYIQNITIKKEELPEEEFITVKGNITGIESDDKNVSITLKSATDTKNVSYDNYKETGVELIFGESYNITAIGDKGYYKGQSFTPDRTGTADLAFSRFELEFPFDLTSDFDNFKDYLTAMGYGSKNVTDAYSGITIYKNGMFMFAPQYGAKAGAEDLISFRAKQTGTCDVSVNVTVANNGANSLQLKVGGTLAGQKTDVTPTGTFTLSANVKEGDIITISAPDRANLYYNRAAVTYKN